MEKKYSNGEVTILWKPDLCIHAAKCVEGLPNVFRPNEKPWIKPDEADTSALVDRVKKCPSGALSILENNLIQNQIKEMESTKTMIEVNPNGPLKVAGPCEIKMSDGSSQVVDKDVFLCRCGESQNKPFCDGGHRKADFKPDAV